jgi:uncharacterized coiled-coil protein SlyX
MSDDRLMALEIKAAYFEKMSADLDQVVRELSAEVTALRREVENLRGRLESPEPQALDPNERPPHY